MPEKRRIHHCAPSSVQFASAPPGHTTPLPHVVVSHVRTDQLPTVSESGTHALIGASLESASLETLQKGSIRFLAENSPPLPSQVTKFAIRDLNLYYDSFQALNHVSMDVHSNEITALIGPSGCGKSTLIKTLNRMNDLIEGCRIAGTILLDNEDIFARDMNVNLLRKRVGMVFQKPNPFPMSIYDNVAFGPRTHGVKKKSQLDDSVEKSLRDAAIFDELKDRLKRSALSLSGGQQQRLCIARALAVEPEVLLMDEPTSALDPISTGKIEDLAVELKDEYTIIIVTHNMQQAARISDKTAFFLLGELIEFNRTEKLFSMPEDTRTEDYITGRFG